MKFGGLLSTLVILGTPAAAASQTPTPETTAFDGSYIGTGTITHANPSVGGCRTVAYVEMVITRGQVSIHIKWYNTPGNSTYLGIVNAAGKVSTSREVVGHWITVSGIIRDKVFTGASSAHASSRNTCFYSFPGPAPMTPFDGWYRGVSGEVLDGGRNEPLCDPRVLAPPAPLKVTNGVAGTSGESWPWEGTVSPQGGVVLRSPRLSRIEGEIDARGTVRAQAPRRPDLTTSLTLLNLPLSTQAWAKRSRSGVRFTLVPMTPPISKIDIVCGRLFAIALPGKGNRRTIPSINRRTVPLPTRHAHIRVFPARSGEPARNRSRIGIWRCARPRGRRTSSSS
jgi:hypothetical protein